MNNIPISNTLSPNVVTKEDIDWILEDARTIAKEQGKTLKSITIMTQTDDNGEIYLAYKAHYFSDIKRTRRITGYFSDINNFNPAKRAELADRKAHM